MMAQTHAPTLRTARGQSRTERDLAPALDDLDKRGLVGTIVDESERLNRFIANLLDMTKLESGAVTPRFALVDLGELVVAALKRASTVLARHPVKSRLAEDIPMLSLDAVLFEQVLFNLLDNAAKYAAEQTTISIQTWQDNGFVCLQILDEGDGLSDEDAERIF